MDNTKYKSLFNDSSVNADSSVFGSLTVTDNFNVDGAIIDSLPVDNSTIEYNTYLLRVKDNGITNAKINSVDASKITGTYTPDSINTDVINEKTTDNGVSIEGVKMKDAGIEVNTIVPITGVIVNVNNVDIGDNVITVDNIESTPGNQITINDVDIYTGGNIECFTVNATSEVMTENLTLISGLKQGGLNVSSLTDSVIRNYALPDQSGTIALISDITGGGTVFSDADFQVYNATDNTKKINLDLASVTGEIDLGFPFVSTTDNFVLGNASMTVRNKNLVDDNVRFIDDTYNKIAYFNCDSITTGTPRTVTFADDSGVMVLTDTVQALTNKTITGVIFDTAPTFTGWVKSDLVSVDTIYNKNASTDLTLDTMSTEKVKIKDSKFQIIDNSDTTKKIAFEASGITTATIRTLTCPDASGTLVLNDNTAALTNKSMDIKDNVFKLLSNTNTSNKVIFDLSAVSGTRTLSATVSGTLTLNDATQTLTNKTITDSTNILNPYKEIRVKKNNNNVAIPSSVTQLTTPVMNSVAAATGDCVEHSIVLNIDNATANSTNIRFIDLRLFKNSSLVILSTTEILNVTTGTEYINITLNWIEYYSSAHTDDWTISVHCATSSVCNIRAGDCTWIMKRYFCGNYTENIEAWA